MRDMQKMKKARAIPSMALDETGVSLLGDDPLLSWQSAVVVTACLDRRRLERPYLGFEPRQALVLQMIRPGIAEVQKLVL
jgi:hypothetical protein